MMREKRAKTKAPAKFHREGLTIIQLLDIFPNDEAAEKWFEKQRWGDKRCCPDCGSTNTVATTNRKPMPYRCRDCRRHFSVRKGTAMQSSKIGYRKWAIGIYMMSKRLKGLSGMTAYRELGITQKTAWYLTQRIREGFFDDPTAMQGPVKVDETYVGGKRRNMPKAKRAKLDGRGAVDKTAVVGAKGRNTKQVRARVVDNTKSETHLKFVRETVVPESGVNPDDAPAYIGLKDYSHESVNHSGQQYVKG